MTGFQPVSGPVEQVNYLRGGAGCLAAPLAQTDRQRKQTGSAAPIIMIETNFLHFLGAICAI